MFVLTHPLTMQKRWVLWDPHLRTLTRDAEKRKLIGFGVSLTFFSFTFCLFTYKYIYIINNNIFSFCKRKEREKKLVEDAVEPTSKGGGLCPRRRLTCNAPFFAFYSFVYYFGWDPLSYPFHFNSIPLPARNACTSVLLALRNVKPN